MQTIIVGAIVVAAVAFIARRVWRSVVAARTPASACGDGGACSWPDAPRHSS